MLTSAKITGYDLYSSNHETGGHRLVWDLRIAFDLKAPENAAGQLDRLEKQIDSLDSMPRRFPAYRREPWHSRGMRMMPVDNYIVLYVPDDATAVVFVLRIMYKGRNIDAQLQSLKRQEP